MKKILLGIALLMATAAGYAQTTVVSGQILDPASNPYRNAVVTVDFINNSSLIAKWNNFPLTVTTWTTNADSNGNFSQALPDLNFIAPATGTFYNFRICANTLVPPGQPTNPCFTYASPACPNVGCITGATITITAAIQAVSLPVPNALLTNVVTNPNASQTITGQKLTLTPTAPFVVAQSNTVCFADGVNATLAQAITCAGSSGTIEVPPSAGTLSVASNTTIPAGVTLKIDQGALLSIANAVTLTINGPLIAPAIPLFTYTGTGTVSIGSNSGANPLHSIWFPGADMAASILNAYKAAASGGQTIIVDPQANGACWNVATTISFSTLGKQVTLTGPLDGSACLNETRTGGTSASITAISETGNTVTATSTLNPGAGNLVTVSGYVAGATCQSADAQCFDAYNGTFKVATSSASNFTYSLNKAGIASNTTGTATLPVATIVIDYGAGSGSTYVQAGVRDLTLSNNGCAVNGGCGNATIAIEIGPVNGGGGQLSLERLNIGGFGAGELVANGASFAINHQQDVYTRNTIGYDAVVSEEGETWTNGLFIFNGVGASIAGGEAKFNSTHFDSNTVGAITTSGGTVTLNGVHMENLGPTTTHYLDGIGNWVINGGVAIDDDSNAGHNADFWFNNVGSSSAQVYGLNIGTLGRTASNIISFGQTGEAHFVQLFGNFGANPVCPNFSTTTICSLTTNSGNTPFMNVPRVGLGTTGSPVNLVASGSGGNTVTVPTLATGVVPIVVAPPASGNVFRVTADFTDASSTSLQTITGLTWVLPASTAQNYSFDCHLAYSQATNVADAFGIQVATNAPTNVFATGIVQTNAGVYGGGTLATLNTTTATNIFTFTPASTGVLTVDLYGQIENPSVTANTVNIMVSQSTAADLIVIKRGSWCRVY